MSKLCIVFLCNKIYFNKFIYTCQQLITVGNYKGEICLVIGNDLLNDSLLDNNLIRNNNILIKHFPDIKFDNEFLKIQYNLNRPKIWYNKLFQYHKLYLFDTYFKKWDYIFYIDCGITILSDIQPILNSKKSNILLAHSDAYPKYEWKLYDQFDNNLNTYFSKLNNNYKLNIDYFQTTIMLYDTNIINENIFNDLYNLTINYPISKTNDQGIIALYFTNVKQLWEQIMIRNIDTYFYDYSKRNINDKYIMVKSI
jgi:hypothetical protein